MRTHSTYDEIRISLTEKGFQEFDPPAFSKYERAYKVLQKRYRDNKGTRYFIDASVYDFTFTDKVPENFVVGYEGQFYEAGTHNAVNIEFVDWELEEVEIWLDKLFDAGLLEYYEED